MLQVGDLQEVAVFDGNNVNHAKMTRTVIIRVRAVGKGGEGDYE
jgi:hypothetical protein